MNILVLAYSFIFARAQEAGQVWEVNGPCLKSDSCISSPGFPASYGSVENCTFKLNEPGWLNATVFNTEAGYDFLQVDGRSYSGSVPSGVLGPRGGLVGPNTTFTWTSDEYGESSGWQLCLGKSVTEKQ
jgi:hypothetical protein